MMAKMQRQISPQTTPAWGIFSIGFSVVLCDGRLRYAGKNRYSESIDMGVCVYKNALVKRNKACRGRAVFLGNGVIRDCVNI